MRTGFPTLGVTFLPAEKVRTVTRGGRNLGLGQELVLYDIDGKFSAGRKVRTVTHGDRNLSSGPRTGSL